MAQWLRTPIDLVIAVGPICSPAERAALLKDLPIGTDLHWVHLDAPVSTTLARATRGLSREAAFHHERRDRFRRLLADAPELEAAKGVRQ